MKLAHSLLAVTVTIASLSFAGSVKGETVDARCDVYPKGSDRATSSVYVYWDTAACGNQGSTTSRSTITASVPKAIAQSAPSTLPTPTRSPVQPATQSNWKNLRLVHTLNASENNEVFNLLKTDANQRVSDSIQQAIQTNPSSYPVSISPDGQYLVAGGIYTLRLWELKTGKEITNSPLTSQATGANEQILASGIVLPLGIGSVAFSPDGGLLSVAGSARMTLAKTPNGSSINSTSMGTVEVWRLSLGRLFRIDSKSPFGGGQAVVNASEQLIYSSDAGVKVLSVGNQKEIFSFPEFGTGNQFFALIPNADALATLSFGGVEFHSLKDGKSLGVVRLNARNSRITVSSDGEMLASIADGGAITFINIKDLQARLQKQQPLQMTKLDSKHQAEITFLAFSPDRQVLATASKDKTVKLWNVKTGALIKTITEHGAEMTAVAFAPDGKTLVTSGMDAKVRVWRND